MLTFREFIDICEVKVNPPNAVKGSLTRSDDGVIRYTLSDEPLKKPNNIQKELDRQGGSGGTAISKYLKKKVKKAQRIGEDIQQLRRSLDTISKQDAPAEKLEQRRNEAKQRSLTQRENARKKIIQHRQDYAERLAAEQEKQKNQQEDLQLEQVPSVIDKTGHNERVSRRWQTQKSQNKRSILGSHQSLEKKYLTSMMQRMKTVMK